MKIKRQPEDFIVQEVLHEKYAQQISPQGGLFALYELSKHGLSTPEAASAIGKKLRLWTGAIAFGGLKDKYAQVSQHVTIAAAATLPESATGPGWQIQRLGWVEQPFASSAIAANRFQIVLRDLDAAQSRRLEEAAALLRPAEKPSAARVVNYFGDQRFGSARAGKGYIAAHLIRGEFEQALKLALAEPAHQDQRQLRQFKRVLGQRWGRWREALPRLPKIPERRVVEQLAREPEDFARAFKAMPYLLQQLWLEAYQSYLWNMIAIRLIRSGCPKERLIFAEGLLGKLVFAPAADVPAELAGLELPLLGRNSPLEGSWQEAAQQVLQREGITTKDLRIPHLQRPYFGKGKRRLFVDADEFVLGEAGKDSSGSVFRRLSFSLPRGAYATVLLRALGQPA